MIGEAHFAARRQACDAGTLVTVPNVPGVLLLQPTAGDPYLARTALLRRRLLRLKWLHGIAQTIEYWPTRSRLESAILFYTLARRHFPDTYLKLTKLYMPAWVKLTANRFPRTTLTSRLAGRGAFYGPFRSRATAEAFNAQTLDLFQVRRCEENLTPDPAHPGCMYGEMAMCLRPCQAVVGDEEYASEVARLGQFLNSRGASLVEKVTHARDRASDELNFEEAARQHKRLERVEGVLKLRDELVANADHLNGVAVTPSVEPHTVTLWFMQAGVWADPVDFPLAAPGSAIVPLDRRLREAASTIAAPKVTPQERQEHVALLARWFYSSWRDGEWFGYDHVDKLPYRRTVNAIARVAKSE